jgi:hypothetical protein
MELLKRTIDLKTFILIDFIKDFKIVDNLLEEIHSAKEKDFLKHPSNVVAKHTRFNYLSESKNFHKFLISIDEQIKLICKQSFLIEFAWANIYNGSDTYVREHTHEDATAFSGILYLTDGPGPGTYFNDYDKLIKEEKGKFVLFHGHLKHSVPKYVYNKDRITISWNFKKCPTGSLDNYEHKIINNE